MGSSDLENLLAQLSQAVNHHEEGEAEDAARLLIQYSRAEGQAESVARQMQALLLHPLAEMRWWACRVLGSVHTETAVQLLLPHLQDPENSVRLCAARALQEQRSPAAIGVLAGLLAHDDSLMRRLTADALIAIGKPSVPALLQVMETDQGYGRQQATRALALIGDERAIPALFKALDDESTWVTHWANEGLERLGVGMQFFKP